jgi:hypothetical protein
LFSDNYFIKSEWSAKTIKSNPLNPMSTLDISGGGNPNIEQAELFMSVVWALLTASPNRFSVRVPGVDAMREQFLLEEITWLPPINDKPETFSEYGMTSEYQKMYLIQDRLLGDMIRVVCPELIYVLTASAPASALASAGCAGCSADWACSALALSLRCACSACRASWCRRIGPIRFLTVSRFTLSGVFAGKQYNFPVIATSAHLAT